MIKKYQIYPNSDFNKSIILTLFERGEHGFHIAGLNSEETNDLFPRNFKQIGRASCRERVFLRDVRLFI